MNADPSLSIPALATADASRLESLSSRMDTPDGARRSGTGSTPVPPATAAGAAITPIVTVGQVVPPVPGQEEKERIESLLAAAETEFRATVDELREDDVMQKFRAEYEKLHRSLARSVMTGLRMFDSYASLHRTYHENTANAKTLGESTSHDEQTIRSLKGQIKRANEFLESSRMKEEKTKDELRSLRLEVNDLRATVSQGVGLSAAQERNINDLIKMKEEALKDLESETDKIGHLRGRIADMSDQTRTVDGERRSLENDVLMLKERIAARKIDIEAETRNKDNLEADLRDMRAVVSVKIADVRTRQEAMNRALEDVALLQNQVKSQKQMLDKVGRDYDALVVKATKYRAECDEQVAITNGLIDQNAAIAKDLHARETELNKVSDELLRCTKIRDGLQKKIRALESRKHEAEAAIKALREDTVHVHGNMDAIKLDIDKAKKALEDLSRERGILSQNFMKLTSDADRAQHLLLIVQQTRANLEQDQASCLRLVAKNERVLSDIYTERDMYASKADYLHAQIASTLARIKLRETEIYQHKKAVVEAETKLKYQQNLYDTVQADRNLHAKNLVDALNDIAEVKRQLKIMAFAINGLKEEYAVKQDNLDRETADRERLDKEMEQIETEIKNLKQQNELAQAYVRSQLTEENKLAQYLKDAEAEKLKQEHALAVVVSERDRLSAQLIKQDADLLKVYDAIKAGQFALLRSQCHFAEKRRQMMQLEREVRQFSTELRLLKLATRDHDVLKKAVLQLKAALLEEQSHLKVLADETKNPINVHRWRRMEGSDPGQLATIQLVHMLQRTLIARVAEDHAKEQAIHEHESVYLQLKEIASRQVGPESIEQVLELERVLKEKKAEKKHMHTEVSLLQAQIKEHQYALNGLTRQLAELKALYFERKQHERKSAAASGGGGGGAGWLSKNRKAVALGLPRTKGTLPTKARGNKSPVMGEKPTSAGSSRGGSLKWLDGQVPDKLPPVSAAVASAIVQARASSLEVLVPTPAPAPPPPRQASASSARSAAFTFDFPDRSSATMTPVGVFESAADDSDADLSEKEQDGLDWRSLPPLPASGSLLALDLQQDGLNQ
ncbi:hypothetical protein BC828DRAFT_379159 [Blastocladiella britannica]|nr:hypothetical protein BC828DRAFT_379159 [Blastocladiella britannica]